MVFKITRLRHVDSDLKRADRQKAVLEAAFNKVKKQPVSKYPDLIKKALGVCNTNLSSAELLKLAKWAIAESPEFISKSIPDDGEKIYSNGGDWKDGKGWVYKMDLNYATAYLHDFIYETNTCETMTPVRPN